MVVMTGDSSVGKSCLLRRFAQADFYMSDNHVATVGVDFMTKTIPVFDTTVKLQVWDTAG